MTLIKFLVNILTKFGQIIKGQPEKIKQNFIDGGTLEQFKKE